MSIHIGAEKGQVAPIVLFPGDPIRARNIAEYLFGDDVQPCHNVRGNPCFTGSVVHDGVRLELSSQASGMGMSTLAIYATELYREYDVQTIIRVGTCGAYLEHLKPGDLVIAQSASTDASFINLQFNGMSYAPVPDPVLFINAVLAARKRGWDVHVGGILSTDSFYNLDDPKIGDGDPGWKLWQRYGVLAVEMESSRLFTIASQLGRRALTILTVSDSLVTGESMSADQRATCYPRMITLAMDSVSAK